MGTNTTGGEAASENRLSRLKVTILDLYSVARSNLAQTIIVWGFIQIGLGYYLDPTRFPDPALGPIDLTHSVFAGILAVWGTTTVIFGVLMWGIFKGLYLYGRYLKDDL